MAEKGDARDHSLKDFICPYSYTYKDILHGFKYCRIPIYIGNTVSNTVLGFEVPDMILTL